MPSFAGDSGTNAMANLKMIDEQYKGVAKYERAKEEGRQEMRHWYERSLGSCD
jgi:hypothetical protein